VADGFLSLGDGTATFINITGAFGTFFIDAEGIAGALSVKDVTVTIPNVSLSTDKVTVEVNTRPNAVTDEFILGEKGAKTLTLPAGPYLRVTVSDAKLTIDNLPDASLKGRFSFDQVDGITRLALFDVTAEVVVNGEGARLINGLGALIVTADGIAGTVEGSLDVSLGELDAGGDLFLRINNTGGAVDQTILIDSRSISISFSETEGMTFSVSIANASLRIGDIVLIQGSFSFEKRGEFAVAGGSDLSIFIGEGEPFLEDGGFNPSARGILIENANIGLVRHGEEGSFRYAVTANGTIRVLGIAGLDLSGSIDVRVSTIGFDVDQDISIPGLDIPISVRFSGVEIGEIGLPFVDITAPNLPFGLDGLSINADLSFNRPEINLNGEFEFALLISLENVSTSIGGGLFTVDGEFGDILILSSGIVANIGGLDIGVNVPGLELNGEFALKVNTTGQVFAFDIQGTQRAINVRAGPFVQISGTDDVSIDIAGQRLTGKFDFQQLASGTIKGTFSEVELSLGTDTQPLVGITGAAGDLKSRLPASLVSFVFKGSNSRFLTSQSTLREFVSRSTRPPL
jgi:hypothetical protein